VNEEPKPLRYLGGVKGIEASKPLPKGGTGGGGGERGTEAPLKYLKGLRRLRRYLKGASKPSKVP